MILEATKRSKGVGYSSLSLRTHVRWDGQKWESITRNTIFINQKTTAIALVSSLESGILSSIQTINRITYNETTATISYDSTFTEDIYKNYYNKVLYALVKNFDPVRFYDDGFALAQDRTLLSSVKANMHTIQTVLETYAVDWGGVYPENVETLKNEASSKNYWKVFKNPFNPFNPSPDAPVVINDSEYNLAKNTLQYKGQTIENAEFFKGAVTYEPGIDGQLILSYSVYGLDSDGDYIKDQGAIFYLTNN